MAAASPRLRDSIPPPMIGRAGSYTVFITPLRTPKQSEGPRAPADSPTPSASSSPRKVAPLPVRTPPRTTKQAEGPGVPADSAKRSASFSPGKVSPLPAKSPPSPSPLAAPPPVQVPPPQFEKPAAKSSGSVFGFFWDAVARAQDAHSSLDAYFANWFGLDQSKYQRELNDYYENHGKVMEGSKDVKSRGFSKGL